VKVQTGSDEAVERGGQETNVAVAVEEQMLERETVKRTVWYVVEPVITEVKPA